MDLIDNDSLLWTLILFRLASELLYTTLNNVSMSETVSPVPILNDNICEYLRFAHTIPFEMNLGLFLKPTMQHTTLAARMLCRHVSRGTRVAILAEIIS
jgi:hypothetical protein